MVNGEQSIRSLLNEKLNSLSAVLRLGYEASQKGTLQAVALHIVNNSRMLAPFDRCCLVDMRGGKPEVLAVMGVSEVNSNSEFCVKMRGLLQPFTKMDRSLVLREDVLKGANASKSALEAYEYFKRASGDILLIPLREPDKAAQRQGEPDGEFVLWVVEFFEGMGTDTEKLLLLMSQMYSVAVWYSMRRKCPFLGLSMLKKGRLLSPGRVLAAIMLVAILCMVFVKVDQSALADFELEPTNKCVEYAPFTGMIKKSFCDDGQPVHKGDIVIEYDTDMLYYELSGARKEYAELCAELEMTRQNSFKDPDSLGKIKVLEAKCERKKVDMDKIHWYINKGNVRAEKDGLISIGDPDTLSGKAVEAGSKLFEIMSDEKLVAKVLLNESDASLICTDTALTLYLHSMPAIPIPAEVISTSPRPAIQADRKFCYVIKAALLPGDQVGLLCGMRGVAKVSGRKVSLGYYLFRNVLLWWRKI